MSARTLEERIEAWPLAWKEARLRCLEARARVRVIDSDLVDLAQGHELPDGETMEQRRDALQGQLAVARAQFELARIELAVIDKSGDALRMLVELRKANSEG